MKTLILNGFPRINGDTSRLIRKIIEKKIDEYKIVDTVYSHNTSIRPAINDEHTLMGLDSI